MTQIDLLVLGASGRVGQLLRRAWPTQDARVRWQYRTATPDPQALIWRLPEPLPQAKTVLVLSGLTRGTPEALDENVSLAKELAEAICASGAELALFASTMAVYGRTPPGGASEQSPPDQPRPYGAAKLRAETAFLAACAGRCRATALRFGNVAGADLLGDVLASGAGITLDRFGAGGPRRSYLGIAQLIRLLQTLPQQPEALPEILNVAGQGAVDMGAILRAANIPFAWQPAPETALEVAAMDCSRLAALLPPQEAEETAAALARDLLARLGAATPLKDIG